MCLFFAFLISLYQSVNYLLIVLWIHNKMYISFFGHQNLGAHDGILVLKSFWIHHWFESVANKNWKIYSTKFYIVYVNEYMVLKPSQWDINILSYPLFYWYFLYRMGYSREKKKQEVEGILFFNCYLAAPRLTLGHSQEDSLSNPMLITAFLNYFSLKVTRSLVMRLGP